MRCLVTAGSTRERIDDVRDWGNIFTGHTGYAIARAVAAVAEVDLVTSNQAHVAEVLSIPSLAAHPIEAHAFSTHAHLRETLAALMHRNRYDAVFMSAAVSDYRPVRVYAVVSRNADAGGEEKWVVRDVQAGKVKSTHPSIAVLGEQTEKLVDLFRGAWGHQGLLVKFKLEVGLGRDELIAVGQKSRVASGAEYLVANTLDMVNGEGAGAFLLSAESAEWVPRAGLPGRLAKLVTDRREPH